MSSQRFLHDLAFKNCLFLSFCSCTETLNHGRLPPHVLCKKHATWSWNPRKGKSGYGVGGNGRAAVVKTMVYVKKRWKCNDMANTRVWQRNAPWTVWLWLGNENQRRRLAHGMVHEQWMKRIWNVRHLVQIWNLGSKWKWKGNGWKHNEMRGNGRTRWDPEEAENDQIWAFRS